MPEIAHHEAVDFVDGLAPPFKRYPPGTCFDCQVDHVQIRYDHSAGAVVMTQVLRVTGARDGDGNALPFPPSVTDQAAATETLSVQRD